jgi:ATP-dependent exoDNAse (exonuclease V) alpha subunit
MRTGILGAAGTALLDFAQGAKDHAASHRETSDSIPGEVQTRLLAAGGVVAEKLGLLVADFQRVDGVESVAARSALATVPSEPALMAARELGLKRAELRNLEKYGNKSGIQTLLVMDETSLTGAADLAKLTKLGREISARTVLQGDTKQHGSPAAGRAFAQAQALGMKTSALTETMRFTEATQDVKNALEHMQQGRFQDAMASLKTKTVNGDQLAKTVAERYVEILAELGEARAMPGSVGVATLTNHDRKMANSAIHSALRANGSIGAEEFTKEHLDAPKMTRAEHHFVNSLKENNVSHLVFFQPQRGLRLAKGEVVAVERYDADRNMIHAITKEGRSIIVNPSKHEGFKAAVMEQRQYSVGDRVEAREVIRWKAQKGPSVNNGTRGRIETIDQHGLSVQWDDGRTTSLTNSQARFVDLAYARTTFKEQGATNKHELLMVSETGANIFNREAAYVAATRAKLNTEVITSDRDKMLRNAGKDVAKETALTRTELRSLIAQGQERERAHTLEQQKALTPKVRRIQELTRD